MSLYTLGLLLLALCGMPLVWAEERAASVSAPECGVSTYLIIALLRKLS